MRVVSILLIASLLGVAIANRCAHGSANIIIFAVSLLRTSGKQLSSRASSKLATIDGTWGKVKMLVYSLSFFYNSILRNRQTSSELSFTVEAFLLHWRWELKGLLAL